MSELKKMNRGRVAIDLFFNCCFVVCLKSLALFPAKFHEGMKLAKLLVSFAKFSSLSKAVSSTLLSQLQLMKALKYPLHWETGEIGSSDDGMPPPSVWGAM
ncbi:hypothetical protein HID58_057803 [Brassica napus]|uniref:Uncharacterized protein n=1 Tax=Brassica napus TaxID=3708 RepID=A0ABQ7XFA2_BRANA|nr:hypothetical protein HID58_057803 [Brassica napus]